MILIAVLGSVVLMALVTSGDQPGFGAPEQLASRHDWPWALSVTALTLGFVVAYLAIVSQQGNRPPPSFLAALAVAGLLPVAGALRPTLRRRCFALSASLLSGLTLLAVLSIGMLLVPAALVAWIGYSRSAPRPAAA